MIIFPKAPRQYEPINPAEIVIRHGDSLEFLRILAVLAGFCRDLGEDDAEIIVANHGILGSGSLLCKRAKHPCLVALIEEVLRFYQPYAQRKPMKYFPEEFSTKQLFLRIIPEEVTRLFLTARERLAARAWLRDTLRERGIDTTSLDVLESLLTPVAKS
jgi:hypothetical protein